jgi:hypothetical protein
VKKILLLTLAVSACFALPPKKIEDMTCMELLDEIKTMERYKAEQERGNYQELERIAAVLITHTLHVGDFRSDGHKIDIKSEIKNLRAKLPNCKSY